MAGLLTDSITALAIYLAFAASLGLLAWYLMWDR